MRRVGLGALALVVLLALIWTGWWFYLERRLQAGVEQWAVARRAEGWTVRIGSVRLGGWPATARLALSDVAVAGVGLIPPTRFDWRAPLLDLDLPALSPTVLVIRPRGRQVVAIAGGAPVAITGTMEIGLDLQRRQPPTSLAFTGRSLRVEAPGLDQPALVTRVSGHATFDPTAEAHRDAVGVQFVAGRIELPPTRAWPLGKSVQEASADLALSGPAPRVGSPEQRARQWRNAGGMVSLRQGTLHWGPLHAALTGSAGLDVALQPTATLVVHATGYAQAMDVLAAHHVLPDHAALVAKAVLSLLADSPGSGGPSVLTVPLELRDGTLAAHGIPLVRVGTLAWRAAGSG